MIKNFTLTKNVKYSVFKNKYGKAEYYFVICSDKISFKDSLQELTNQYLKVLKKNNLSPDSCVFSRFYLSDMANQEKQFFDSSIYRCLKSSARSIVQQPPLLNNTISLLCYHIDEIPNGNRMKSSKENSEQLKLTCKNYELLFFSNIINLRKSTSGGQTSAIFNSYINDLRKNKMTLCANVLRTWIYVRDIDNNYIDMTESRRKIFSKEGLTETTRYIASTGIEGKMLSCKSLISMDAVAISKLSNRQIIKMEALKNMCSTSQYKVTFDRGTRVKFGDRSHLYISGTASINNKGELLYPLDPIKQTIRAIKNIIALLKPHNASLNNMAYFIVYLRNHKDELAVIKTCNCFFNENIPKIIVEGAVCRPGWLVEIEGVAIVDDKNSFPVFC